MPNISLDDAMFLLGEKAGKPAHVIALQLWDPPADAGPDFTTNAYQELVALEDIKPVFRKRPKRSLASPSTLKWVDEGWDPDFHIRHAALARPGRVRELLETVSLQHGVLLDRNRPLWEYHLYEGLHDGRFATTFKTHHSLADGMSLAHHVLGGLSPDPDARDCTPPWVRSMRGSGKPKTAGLPQARRDLLGPARMGASTLRTLREMAGDTHASLPFEAPTSIMNQGLSGARRFAGDMWEHARLKAIATAAGCSVNDVVLAVCGGALRAFLDELGELPDRSLIAMVPVSLRRPDAQFSAGEGNAFGALLCDLGTTESSALVRLESIREQMKSGKERLSQLSPKEAQAVSRLIMGGAIVSAMGINLPRQPFNLIISNVPASTTPLYWNGAKLTDIYPISMISEGQCVNITVTRYADNVSFGIVGDRKAVPHLQRMLIHVENSIAELEKVSG